MPVDIYKLKKGDVVFMWVKSSKTPVQKLTFNNFGGHTTSWDWSNVRCPYVWFDCNNSPTRQDSKVFRAHINQTPESGWFVDNMFATEEEVLIEIELERERAIEKAKARLEQTRKRLATLEGGEA